MRAPRFATTPMVSEHGIFYMTKKRDPWTVEHITKLKQHLNLTDPLHVAAFACLTTAFYGCARLGEFTTRTLKAFNPTLHVKPLDVRKEVDQGQQHSMVFHLPRTKALPAGEDVSWAKQYGETDPDAAFQAHLDANQPPQMGPLFAYTMNRAKTCHKPLTKAKFLEVMHSAATRAGLEPLKGHGIHIGSTLEYLLHGIPFDIMKERQILAPYMQAQSAVHQDFVHIVMPPLRR
ncbi:hypothetical protein FA15DRAFT_683580 [Coprinopsis marcescibilis]|uniref:Tyr recombinase domain-containing protein n=1 Tax=Coprinopsis marcescibilis TaxID=230819 RepID=A0A5C3KBW7_COPMA|nr:hypothetical protein FA15DRAFT_683580 [Coprinopsis marcescibilis]